MSARNLRNANGLTLTFQVQVFGCLDLFAVTDSLCWDLSSDRGIFTFYHVERVQCVHINDVVEEDL